MSYCKEHQRAEYRRERELRPKNYGKLYGYQWQQARLVHLREYPLCVHCLEKGRTTAAADVDHIERHNGDAVKFWDTANWQSLCKACHTVKTKREARA